MKDCRMQMERHTKLKLLVGKKWKTGFFDWNWKVVPAGTIVRFVRYDPYSHDEIFVTDGEDTFLVFKKNVEKLPLAL